MSDVYWYIEYGKVLAAYAALLYIWPSVVFRTYLKGKGRTFRFLFCVTVPVVLYNGVVLGLGLLGFLNVWIVRALFYGTFLFSAAFPLFARKREDSGLWNLINAPIWRRSPKMQAAFLWDWLQEKGAAYLRDRRRPWMEYVILVALLLFGVMFYSYPALQNPNLGCYDAYTHADWLLSMRNGVVFPNGVYPQAMHCFIYGLNVLFGVEIYSCMLYLAGIHITVFLLSAYLLLRELFLCRYTPLFVLTFFLTFGGCVGEGARRGALLSMTQLTWTIPQEFGWYLVFLCPLLLLRFFREKEDGRKADFWFENPNLLLLAAGAGAAAASHFHAAVLAGVLCLAAALPQIKKIASVNQILTLLYAAVDGLAAGALPMLMAYYLGGRPKSPLLQGVEAAPGKAESVLAGQEAAMEAGRGFLSGFYEGGYAALFGNFGGLVLALTLLIPALIGGLWLYRRRSQNGGRRFEELTWERCAGYLCVAAAVLLLIFLYAARSMGLPELVSAEQLFVVIRVLVYALFWIPVDVLLFLAASGRYERVLRRGAVFVCVGIYCASYLVGFHEYGFWWSRRHEAAVRVTAEITENWNLGEYMVISMRDERWQVGDAWTCVGLLDFMQAVEEKKSYSLPTEYLFLYVEKQPVEIGTRQFFDGPKWLGRKSSQGDELAWSKWYPDVFKGSISRDKVEELDYKALKEEYDGGCFDRQVREALFSKAYYWYQDFTEAHPAETNVYYEDEDFICCVIHQDPEKPLNLSVRG